MISGQGAQIVLGSTPRLGEELTITNLRSGKGAPFRLVRRVGRPSKAASEWGVECLEADARFWGISFPVEPSAGTPGESEVIEALLQCHQCGTQEMAWLSWGEYQTLGKRPFLKRECEQCAAPTDWSFTYLDAEELPPAPGPPLQPASPAEGADRRRARRRTLRVPVRICLTDGTELAAATENLAKIGLCVIAAAEVKTGDVIRIRFGNSAADSGVEVWGRVVRQRPLAGTDKAVYGVRLQDRSQVEGGGTG